VLELVAGDGQRVVVRLEEERLTAYLESPFYASKGYLNIGREMAEGGRESKTRCWGGVKKPARLIPKAL